MFTKRFELEWEKELPSWLLPLIRLRFFRPDTLLLPLSSPLSQQWSKRATWKQSRQQPRRQLGKQQLRAMLPPRLLLPSLLPRLLLPILLPRLLLPRWSLNLLHQGPLPPQLSANPISATSWAKWKGPRTPMSRRPLNTTAAWASLMPRRVRWWPSGSRTKALGGSRWWKVKSKVPWHSSQAALAGRPGWDVQS